ncbi:hypothetical protein N7499_008331 [Penicillium canescens]|uniref:D-xylose 1-dehydrogenase (NADP(+), D-xylono-1,5-lactone-forming) n=1 Tax=Penicillium canescens TaxID=5083 RepID=A0AAD6HYU3_PENCN|nr:uncharacterized protein N7446_013365 [Penicillium canescens]KAJ6023013.1 hypothetical protein N7460_013408 [Penicillium canescens]KAJ6025725.1 hypothetical protein N7444_013404 [Penicillium canescens]KAJ6042299.1 hypothetical protein N7446_013365 [Penicillium canescens]KAJ6076350.1 hypothetical protein N7499_008331 [Penicillium canescens]KAJ6158661.1 hypothetical protein N7485_011487 [Penicillium canescens]
MVFAALYRIYAGFINPPQARKQDDAIRFGLLGASNIAPPALISPAKSHGEVIVAAVAARDRSRAEAYAKKHGIPIVHSSYEDLLNDPSIDAVYIALPNSLHFEWALRAIKARKHVLLEKPSCSNGEEARALFNHPLVKAPNAPVLLEAFHYRFHPAWQTFMSLIHDDAVAGPVKHAHAQQYLFKGVIPFDDIRWRYDLAGGAMMDFGTYTVNCLRQILREEPSQVIETQWRGVPSSQSDRAECQQIDQAMTATYKTESGATGSIIADLATSGGWPLLPSSWTKNLPSIGWPKCEAELGEKEVESPKSADGEKHFVKRKVTLWNHLAPSIYHRIDVEDTHTIHRDGTLLKMWKESQNLKSYSWPSGGKQAYAGEDWWSTYHCQLHEFVNKIKGREGSGVWVDGDDSIKQMDAIDRTYEKAGMKLRPTSKFELPV